MSDRPTVAVKIDDVTVRVPPGTNVVDAAHAVGIEIPVFCHHPKLVPVGMCRMCLVEVGTPAVDRATGEPEVDEDGRPVVRFGPKLVTGCTTPVSEGMVVRTTTPAVAEARRSMLEFLLSSHPLDCPVCDKGGECPLQNLTMRYGPGTSRIEWSQKYRFPKPVPLGPLVALDRERCVLCARCIRFQDEIADDVVLGFEDRNRGMEIVSYSDPPFDSRFSGNTTDVCPVGALTTVDFRLEARVWELVGRPGICVHCPVGCNLIYDTRDGHVKRVMPRQNDEVNEIWLCDKGRFGHHFASAAERLSEPMVRRDGELVPVTWEEALGEAARLLREAIARHGPSAVGALAGPAVPNEDLYMLGRFARAILGTNNVDHRPAVLRDDVLVARGAGVRAPAGSVPVDPTALGAGDVVLSVGLDVGEEAPVLALGLIKGARRGARLVLVGGRPQKLDRRAVVLRWRYGSEQTLLASLLSAAIERGRVPVSAAQASALKGHDASSLSGVHPVRPEDLEDAAEAVARASRLLVLYGREAVELGLVPALAALVDATGRAGEPNDGLLAVGTHANSQGAADMGILPAFLPGGRPVGDEAARAALGAVWPGAVPEAPGLGADDMLAGGVRALFVLGTDPAGDDPAVAASLAGLDALVVQELFPTATARLAHVVLPAQSAAERDGTMTSLLRRVQRTYAAARPVGSSRPGWAIIRDLGQRWGVADAFGGPADVMAEIARAVPGYAGIDYDALGPPAPWQPVDVALPFAPVTDARQVSYQGTAYASDGGRGLTWSRALHGVAGSPRGHAASEAGPPDVPDSAPALDAVSARARSEADGLPVPDLGGEAMTSAGGISGMVQPTEIARAAPDADAAPGEPAAWSPAPAAPRSGLVLVPAPRLLDAGAMISPSAVLWPLVPDPHVEIGFFDAGARGLRDGDRVRVTTAHGTVEVPVRLRDGLTPGVVVAPEGLAWAVPVRALLGGAPFADARVEPVEA